MAPEGGGYAPEGNIAMRRVLGLPLIAWLGIVALGAYLYLNHRSNSAGSPSTSGGGGTATEGATTLQKGAITVTVTQQNPQPGPRVPGRRSVVGTHPMIPPPGTGSPHPSKKPQVHRTTRKPTSPNPGGVIKKKKPPKRGVKEHPGTEAKK